MLQILKLTELRRIAGQQLNCKLKERLDCLECN